MVFLVITGRGSHRVTGCMNFLKPAMKAKSTVCNFQDLDFAGRLVPVKRSPGSVEYSDVLMNVPSCFNMTTLTGTRKKCFSWFGVI